MTISEYCNSQIEETIRILKEAQAAIAQGNVSVSFARLETAKAEINHVSDRLLRATEN